MGFVSNIFKRADKEIKYTHNGAINNADITDVRGYSKAVIQFSGERNFRIYGYIDKITYSQVVSPTVTTLEHRPIIDIKNITEKTVIVDVSDLSVLFINFVESYTGDVFIHLTQDEVKIDRSGVTQIATKYINVVSGTNYYEDLTIENTEIKHFRFIAVLIKRRDGDGYQPFTVRAKIYYNVNKEQGAGSAWNNGDEIINVTNAYFANSGWFENYATKKISLGIYIDGTEFDGALLEINYVGIA